MKLFNRRFLYAVMTIVALAGVIALIAIKGPLSPVPVKIIHLKQGDLQPAVFGVGTVEARRSYAIGPTRSGRLLKLFVDHGDSVKKGQLLGEMDPVDLSERLKSAQLVIEKTEHLVESAKAAVDEAKARALQARKEQNRYKKLLSQRQISREVAEQKEADARATQDKVKQAIANLAGVKHDYERAKEDLKALQAQFNELKLTSPANALITARLVEPGSVVVAGTPVLSMIEPATLWVRTRIDQAKSGQIRIGQNAAIELRNLPGKLIKGSVQRIELIADSLTEERWIDVGFDKRPATLSIGMLANVTIQLPEVKKVNWLPGRAIVYQQGESGVWRVVNGENSKAVFTPVKTGVQTLDGKTQIISGLETQDKVILDASKPVKAGSRIKIIKELK